MNRRRWQDVDLKKRGQERVPPAKPAPVPEEISSASALDPPRRVSHPPAPELAPARACYALAELERCVELLLPLVSQPQPPPGARRLLGLALGRLGAFEQAAAILAEAASEDPDDPELRASLLSAQVLAGQHPAAPTAPHPGALAEISGVLAWLRGQALLRDGSGAEAAAAFHEAGALILSKVPAPAAAERVAAVFIGEAVSRLAAGQLEAAQQCFSRLVRRERLSPETHRFAQQLYEVAEALKEVPPAELPQAVQPLVELITAARLRLRFFDQERPVEIWWDHFP